ncbi:hypothetical protein D8Y24_07375, partial [Agrococcus lahaulensis]
MNEELRARIIASEDATEREYNSGLAALGPERQRLMNATLRNTWTTQVDVRPARSGELVARVDLGEPHPTMYGTREFYIGTEKWEGPEYTVYSWAAPIAACTFYGKPADRAALEEITEAVAGIRRFTRRGGRLADFDDEHRRPDAQHLFPSRGLSVPKAPSGGRARPKLSTSAAPRDTSQETAPRDSRVEHGCLAGSAGSVPPTRASVRQHPDATATGLRAPELLRRELAAPKAASMSAVLATLQPDQYEAIARPHGDSQILQGHPGTGKTIIAAHRAAYLLSPELKRPAQPRGSVLIVGPTDEFVAHIRGVLSKLIDDSSRYEVTSLPTLLDEWAGLQTAGAPSHSVDFRDVDEELVSLADSAFTRAKVNVGAGDWPTAADIYAELVGLADDPPAQGIDREWFRYLRGLPNSINELRRRSGRTHRGLLAYLAVRADRSPRAVGHIVVDEAQDIHPIEWHVLGRLGNTGGWTILGDLNQRRTDHTFSSWAPVAQLLGIEDDRGRAPMHVLDRGYRSTAHIMRFANQLLPKQYRVLQSIQIEGESPKVSRVLSEQHLLAEAIAAAEALLARVGAGTVAVISVRAESIESELRRRGWTRDRLDTSRWILEGRAVRVLRPERAR